MELLLSIDPHTCANTRQATPLLLLMITYLMFNDNSYVIKDVRVYVICLLLYKMVYRGRNKDLGCEYKIQIIGHIMELEG